MNKEWRIWTTWLTDNAWARGTAGRSWGGVGPRGGGERGGQRPEATHLRAHKDAGDTGTA